MDLRVGAGEIFGLLGPNGAGKTTTIGMLTTRVVPTAGRAFVDGIDVGVSPTRVKQRIGVVAQTNTLDRSITVRENLYYHGRYFGLSRQVARERSDELLDRFRLADKRDDRPDHLSGGMAQRLLVARALVHRPAVLFLDEPTTGLDPQSRIALWDLLREFHAEGQTILLTTHYMDEADALCDRVAIMDEGRILALDTPAALMRSLPGSATVEVTVRGSGSGSGSGSGDGHGAALQEVPGVVRVEWLAAPAGGPDPSATPGATNGAAVAAVQDAAVARLRLYVEADPAELVGPVVALLAARGASVADLALGAPSLEDVFISLTGRELR